MVRDNRDQKVSVFGNNTSGGEMIRIQLTKKIANGQYNGKIFVDSYN